MPNKKVLDKLINSNNYPIMKTKFSGLIFFKDFCLKTFIVQHSTYKLSYLIINNG